MTTINLIIDGTFFFRRSLSATDYTKYLNEGELVLDSEKTQGIFIRKVAMDLAFQFKRFEDLGINKVVFCLDKGSWRKKIPNTIYKANRIQDNKVNWNNFYKLTDTFTELLRQRNVIISQIDSAEGDDLIFYWSKLFLSKNESSIIISSDNDLKQLITSKENKSFVIHTNIITNRFSVDNCFHDLLTAEIENKEFDILNIDDEQFEAGSKISILKQKIDLDKLELVDPYDIILGKLILGDKGDNVIQLIPKFGVKSYEKLVELFINDGYTVQSIVENLINNDEPTLDYILESLGKQVKKLVIDDFPKLREHIKTNLQLVVLNNKILPKSILEEFLLNAKQINFTPSYFDFDSLESMPKILENTEYYDPSYDNDDSVFNGVDFQEIDAILG